MKKPLIETSAVRAAIGGSTAAHHAHFAQLVTQPLWTSNYIRQEFIRRWVMTFAHASFVIAQSTDVADGLVKLEHNFKPRYLKAIIASLSGLLRETGTIQNSRAAAEELASLAIRWLEKFDVAFPSHVNNKCGCKRGAMTVSRVDYDHLMMELHDLYEEFQQEVPDCPVNGFLGLGTPNKSHKQKFLADQGTAALRVCKGLAELVASGAKISCRKCSRIGDVIIALEQPPSWCLVHVDHAFNELCRVTGRDHLELLSVTAVEKLAPPDGATNASQTP